MIQKVPFPFRAQTQYPSRPSKVNDETPDISARGSGMVLKMMAAEQRNLGKYRKRVVAALVVGEAVGPEKGWFLETRLPLVLSSQGTKTRHWLATISRRLKLTQSLSAKTFSW